MLSEPKKHVDLAERIQAAILARKDDGGRQQSFILPWRMDAKQNVLYEKGLAECGCGISQDDPQPRLRGSRALEARAGAPVKRV